MSMSIFELTGLSMHGLGGFAVADIFVSSSSFWLMFSFKVYKVKLLSYFFMVTHVVLQGVCFSEVETCVWVMHIVTVSAPSLFTQV